MPSIKTTLPTPCLLLPPPRKAIASLPASVSWPFLLVLSHLHQTTCSFPSCHLFLFCVFPTMVLLRLPRWIQLLAVFSWCLLCSLRQNLACTGAVILVIHMYYSSLLKWLCITIFMFLEDKCIINIFVFLSAMDTISILLNVGGIMLRWE